MVATVCKLTLIVDVKFFCEETEGVSSAGIFL